MVRRLCYCFVVAVSPLALIVSVSNEARADNPASGKPAIFESVNRRDEAVWKVAREIWSLAEPGYQETKSSAILKEMLEGTGFRIESEIGGIPTAFTATVGSGKPVIGILGEFDA